MEPKEERDSWHFGASVDSWQPVVTMGSFGLESLYSMDDHFTNASRSSGTSSEPLMECGGVTEKMNTLCRIASKEEDSTKVQQTPTNRTDARTCMVSDSRTPHSSTVDDTARRILTSTARQLTERDREESDLAISQGHSAVSCATKETTAADTRTENEELLSNNNNDPGQLSLIQDNSSKQPPHRLPTVDSVRSENDNGDPSKKAAEETADTIHPKESVHYQPEQFTADSASENIKMDLSVILAQAGIMPSPELPTNRTNSSTGLVLNNSATRLNFKQRVEHTAVDTNSFPRDLKKDSDLDRNCSDSVLDGQDTIVGDTAASASTSAVDKVTSWNQGPIPTVYSINAPPSEGSRKRKERSSDDSAGSSSGVYSEGDLTNVVGEKNQQNHSAETSLPSAKQSKMEEKTTCERVKQESKTSSAIKKPNDSYIAMIAKAILSASGQRIMLHDIYKYIMDNYAYYNNEEMGWRNSIRHNLSINECFIKNGRANCGRGFYWSIHPACVQDFMVGDFNRRQSRRRVQQNTKAFMQGAAMCSYQPIGATGSPQGYNPAFGSAPMAPMTSGVVQMTSTPVALNHMTSTPQGNYDNYLQWANRNGTNVQHDMPPNVVVRGDTFVKSTPHPYRSSGFARNMHAHAHEQNVAASPNLNGFPPVGYETGWPNTGWPNTGWPNNHYTGQ